MIYRCTFDRIGRNHDVEPVEFDVRFGAQELSEKVYALARKHCASKGIEVVVDLDEEENRGKGTIFAGMHTAGSFTIEEVAA